MAVQETSTSSGIPTKDNNVMKTEAITNPIHRSKLYIFPSEHGREALSTNIDRMNKMKSFALWNQVYTLHYMLDATMHTRLHMVLVALKSENIFVSIFLFFLSV